MSSGPSRVGARAGASAKARVTGQALRMRQKWGEWTARETAAGFYADGMDKMATNGKRWVLDPCSSDAARSAGGGRSASPRQLRSLCKRWKEPEPVKRARDQASLLVGVTFSK